VARIESIAKIRPILSGDGWLLEEERILCDNKYILSLDLSKPNHERANLCLETVQKV
jgi:hypothetical protein